MTYNQKINTCLDDLELLNEKLHKEVNCFAAYGAKKDFLGDLQSLHSFAKSEAISGTDEISDYCVLVDLLLEIEDGYEEDALNHQYMLAL